LYLHSKGHQITQGEMVSGRDAPEEGARKMAARRTLRARALPAG